MLTELTYMSIHSLIDLQCRERQLFFLSPVLPQILIRRDMYVSSEIRDLLFGPWDNKELEKRSQQLRADLEVFIEGKIISVTQDTSQTIDAYLAQLEPPKSEIWEIRSRNPRPSIRVLGSFAKTDVFIALTWFYRNDLGDRNSQEWKKAITLTKAAWRRLFLTYAPISGRMPDDYVSRKAIFS